MKRHGGMAQALQGCTVIAKAAPSRLAMRRKLAAALVFFTVAWPALTLAGQQDEITLGQHIAVDGTQAGYASCAACHRANGSGRPAVAIPRLAGLAQDYLQRQLLYFADGDRHNVIMAPYARRLTDAQRSAAAAYFSSLPAPVTHHAAPDAAQAAVIAHGQELFEAGLPREAMPACIRCHAAGATGVPGFSPALAGQSAPYIVAQLQRWHDGKFRGDAGKFMAAEARHLTEADMDAVAAYLAQLPATTEPVAASPADAAAAGPVADSGEPIEKGEANVAQK